jgi:hypothetical protein
MDTHTSSANQARDLASVLAEEFRLLHQETLDDGASLDKIYEKIHQQRAAGAPQAALCLSGGGIRSASFALGVLQALARRELLDKFHYLSTVSGGGYIGSWLSAWRAHAKDDHLVMQQLSDRWANKNYEEPPELQGVRANSNFLTPRVGLMSADTWTLAALYLRNLLLNWLIYLPMFIAVLLVPIWSQNWLGWARPWPAFWHCLFLAVAVLLLGFALCMSVRGRLGRDASHRVDQTGFLWRELLPTYVAAILFCLYGVSEYRERAHIPHWLAGATPVAIGAAGAALYAFTWVVAYTVYGDPTMKKKGRALLGWAIGGFVGGMVVGWGFLLIGKVLKVPPPLTVEAFRPIVVFGVGWIAASMFIAESIYLGLNSYWDRGDMEREWLARSSGWFLALTIGWAALSALVLYAHDIKAAFDHWFWLALTGGAGAGTIAAGIGSSAKTLATFAGKRIESLSMTKVLSLGAIIFLTTLAIALSLVLRDVVMTLDWDSRYATQAMELKARHDICVATAIMAASVAFICAASVLININRFSAHALYRNRLTRAFLGSARASREAADIAAKKAADIAAKKADIAAKKADIAAKKADIAAKKAADIAAKEADIAAKKVTRDPFTGFDPLDNPSVSTLLHPTGPKTPPRLFHVVNMALNVVAGANNAWQERKAETFVVTPKVSGNEHVGFWPSKTYGFRPSDTHAQESGITLGTAMAISGAAASPNQGYHSSPLIGFIMTLFNVRLGWWLGNPSRPRKAIRQGPWFGILQTIQELFGLTTDKSAYVYLSDGGHFENLGLYEMVRRRCHMILVSDGGCDPDCAFEDLGNAVRKIWIDLGVRIEFKKIDIHKRGLKEKSLYCALGRIYYPEISYQPGGEAPGYVLYIKPGFHDDGREPPDVVAYALANLAFPHETTADQFFTESQMESYRSLGAFIVREILGEKGPNNMDAPTPALRPYWTSLEDYVNEKMPKPDLKVKVVS